MRIKHKSFLFLFILSLALISLSLPLEAALSSKYDSPATSAQGSATVKPSAPAPATAAAPANAADPSSGGVIILERKPLKAMQLKLIEKEHAVYCKAFVDAEMGLRYFYKTQYDAKYRGAKAPTEEELKAMRFELSLLMKDLGSSAKRYASNIRMARMAMLEMEEEERSVFAKMLGQIIGTPAYAVDAGSLSGVEAGLNSIAGATADVGLSSEADYANAEANSAKAGEIIASATSLATTTVLAGATVITGAAVTMGAATTGGAILGGIVLIGGIVGGGLEIVNAGVGFVDSMTEKETDTSTLQKISTTINIVNVGAGANKKELVKVAVETAEATKDMWIPKIFDETQKDDNPGKDGVNKVKNAKKNASSGSGGGGGGGG
jgi:hypothetical protein